MQALQSINNQGESMTNLKIFQVVLMVVTACCFCGAARAELITELESEFINANGINEFIYTINNDMESTLSVSSFVLHVDRNVEIASLSGPDGWSQEFVSNDIDSVVSWEATDFPFVINPGSSARFSISARNEGSLRPYTIFGISESAPFFDSNQGSIISPSGTVIPEPSALLQTGIGMIGLAGGYGWWHSRRRLSQPTVE
jgi:hypothetical protein